MGIETALKNLASASVEVAQEYERQLVQVKEQHDKEIERLLTEIDGLKKQERRLITMLLGQQDRMTALEKEMLEHGRRFGRLEGLLFGEQSAVAASSKVMIDHRLDAGDDGQEIEESVPEYEDDKEDNRTLPFSFEDQQSTFENAPGWKCRPKQRCDIADQPCEPGIDSEAFRLFLKRKRQDLNLKPNFKYVDVVRKREDRNQLEAFECPDCQAFYALMNTDQREQLGDCLRCEAGRHRATHKPPRTPPGFWDLTFPDSAERKRKAKNIPKNIPLTEVDSEPDQT